jgi:hypothetical protein
MRNSLFVGSAACAVLLSAAPAAAMPGSGIGHVVNAKTDAVIEQVGFFRYPDGRVEYRRPRFGDKGPYFFAYRGYAYPYYPGYTYRLYRGKLKPHDRPHRYRIAD